MKKKAVENGDDRFGRVIETLAPLRVTHDGTMQVRVLEMRRGGRRLDVRYHVEAESFQGWTRKGVSLTAEELRALLGQSERILELLDTQPEAIPAGGAA